MQQPETPDTSLPPLSILALVFEDAETLWTGDAAGRLIRWQLRSGRPQQSGLISQGLPVLGLSLQLNNLWVLRPGRLEGFPLDPEATQSPIPLDLPEGLDRLVGRAGRLIAAGDQIAVVLDWLPDESRWTCTAEFGLPRGSTDDLDLSWDGQHFLVAKNKDQIWVGSTRDGSKAGGFSQKRLSQLSARFAPEAGYAYRGCRGSYEIKRVRWKTGQGKIKLETVSAWNCPIEISADGHFLAALLTGNAVQLFDLRTHQAVLYLEPVPDHGSERWKAGMSRVPAAFRHWGANLASVSRWQQPPEAGVVYASMAVAPEGKLVALGGFDGSLILVDPHTCQIQLTSPRPIETPVESPTEGQPEARRSTEIPSAVQPEAHRPVETSPAVGPADRPGSDPQRSKERARTSTRRASKPSNAPARSGWVPESILLQPACSVLLQKLQVRALGVQGQELRILDHESFLWRWAESAARPCAERLDLQPGAPEYFHQHGPLYWDREGIYLLQDRQLTAFEAATGRLVGQQPFPDTRACRTQDGKLWAYQAESSTLQWVKPGLDGAQRGELDTGLTRLARHFSLMPAGRDRLLVAGTSPQSSNPIFQVLDLRDGQKIEVGPALWAWPGADGRHFAVSRNSWSDFEVWDGEQAEAGPRLIWKNRSFPFGGLSCFTVAPGMQAILATESGHGLVVWDAQGRALAHLRGHGERIEGMLPASDGRSVHCWDRASIVRHWAVDSTWPVPVGEAEVLLQGQFQYVPPAQHRAAREAAEQRLVEDPALAQLKARIDQLQADPDALQRYAWTLPDEVHAAIDQRLTGLLGRWRPQREVQGRKVNRWVGLARSADASERATAAWAFSRLGREGKAGLEVLVELLKDPEPSVRWAAVEPLRGLAPWAGEAAELLVGLLAEASKPLFSPAADALRAIGSPAAQALASALTHKKSAVREAAVDLLGDLETGAAPVSAALAEATRDRRSEGVRQAACKALGRIGPAASATVPALLERLEDKALPVQRAAARALGLLRANPQLVIPALDRALDSRDAYLRAAAAEALSCFEELPQAVHKRIRALLDDPELRHWPEIAVVVWQLGGPSDRQAAVQRLAQILKSSPELHRRSSSATALGKLGSEAVAAAKPQLLANLDHPVEYVRRPALEALWTLAARDPEVLARLQDALFRSPDLYFRALAAARMTEPGIPGATSALLKALAQDPEMPVRCSAAEALGKRGDPDAVPGLQAALADPDPQVRLSACESLVALGRTGDDTVAAVLDLLASGPSHLGGGAARLLGRLGRPSQPVILALRRLLDTDSWMEAEQALTALRVSPSGPAS